MQRLHKVAALIAAFIFMALVQTVQAGLIEDIEMVKSDYGIKMTDEVMTFEKRDNTLSNRVTHKGTVVNAGALILRGCKPTQFANGDRVEFICYTKDMCVVRNLGNHEQCVAQKGEAAK
jgi:hypothetical protein